MYETQLYLSYTHQQRVLHVLEHCKFLYSELEKKIANEHEEHITLEKIQFQCPTQLSLPHGRFWGTRITPNSGRDPFNQNFRKFRSKTQWIGSVQPEKFRKNGSTF